MGIRRRSGVLIATTGVTAGLLLASCSGTSDSGSTSGSPDPTESATLVTDIKIDNAGIALEAPVVLPDGSAVYAIGIGQDAVSVIDPRSNEVTDTVSGLQTYGNLMAQPVVAPDGSSVYFANPSSIPVLDTSSNEITDSIDLEGVSKVTGMALSPDGSTLYAAVSGKKGSQSLLFINTGSKQVVDSLKIKDDASVTDVVALSNGSAVYVITTTENAASTALVIDPSSKKQIKGIRVGPGSFSAAALPNSSAIYVSNASSPSDANSTSVSVINTESQSVKSVDSGEPIGEGAPGRAAALPDSSRVYVSGVSKDTVGAIDAPAGKKMDKIQVGGNPDAATVLPDGSAVYVLSLASGTVSVIDPVSDSVVQTLTLEGKGRPAGGGSVALPDSSTVYVTRNTDAEPQTRMYVIDTGR